MIVAVSIRVERVTMCDSPACHLRNLWPGDRVGAAWFKRLRGPPATVNAHPLMVRATNALFHSSPLCGSAATLGTAAARITSHRITLVETCRAPFRVSVACLLLRDWSDHRQHDGFALESLNQYDDPQHEKGQP